MRRPSSSPSRRATRSPRQWRRRCRARCRGRSLARASRCGRRGRGRVTQRAGFCRLQPLGAMMVAGGSRLHRRGPLGGPPTPTPRPLTTNHPLQSGFEKPPSPRPLSPPSLSIKPLPMRQPLDVLRTRMQADAALGARRPAADTLRTLLKEGGVRGMWRGTGPTVVRLSLGAGINFVVLEKLKAAMLHVSRGARGRRCGHFQLFLAGRPPRRGRPSRAPLRACVAKRRRSFRLGRPRRRRRGGPARARPRAATGGQGRRAGPRCRRLSGLGAASQARPAPRPRPRQP
jgi:hypothetical protein